MAADMNLNSESLRNEKYCLSAREIDVFMFTFVVNLLFSDFIFDGFASCFQTKNKEEIGKKEEQ